MQDELNTIINSLDQAEVISEEDQYGRLQKRCSDGRSGQPREQREVPKNNCPETGNFHCCEEEESYQSDRVSVDAGNSWLHQENGPISDTQRNCQNEEKGDGQERSDAERQSEWVEQTIYERQENEVDLETILLNEGMPFPTEDIVVATLGTPCHGDELWWAPCISKMALAKLLGKCKCCLPKQLTQELEEERQILERMEKIECSLTKISQRLDRLSQNGYVCNRHTSRAANYGVSHISNNSECCAIDEKSEDFSNEDEFDNSSPSSECTSGPNCVGKMVSFNSSLVRSIDSTYLDDSEDLNDNCDSSVHICCSSSSCQGIIKDSSYDKRLTNSISRQQNSSYNEKSLSGFNEYSPCDSKMCSSSVNETPSNNKKSSISFKDPLEDKQECSFLGKEFLSCSKRSTSCKNSFRSKNSVNSLSGKKDLSPCKMIIQNDKDTPFCSKASVTSKLNKMSSFCRDGITNKKDSSYLCKESSSKKTSLLCNKKCSSLNTEMAPKSKLSNICNDSVNSQRECSEMLAPKSKLSNFCNDSINSQREFNSSDNDSLECEELSDTANETELSCEEMSLKEPSTVSQPTTLTCEIGSENQLEKIIEDKEKEVPYSDDYEPYLIKKPDAMPRSMQRKLARLEAEQRQAF